MARSDDRGALLGVLARNVRAARTDAGLSQAQLAARAGISQHSLSRIERARQDARFDTLVRLAEALDVPLARLVDQHDSKDTGRLTRLF